MSSSSSSSSSSDDEQSWTDKYEHAQSVEAEAADDAAAAYVEILEHAWDAENDLEEFTEYIKVQEKSFTALGKLYAKQKQTDKVASMLSDYSVFLESIPKAKTAKLVRDLLTLMAEIPDTLLRQIELCKECIEWANTQKRKYLRQRIEARLAALHLEAKQYTLALELLARLLGEVKRLDDKLLLVEIQLVESRVHYALRNGPKAKASLVAARTAAHAIYCPPMLQAEIDMQSGVLHAEEKDYKTAYSYFFECFEGYNSIGENDQAVLALKYMLLTKVMTGNTEDVYAIIDGKLALKYAGREVDAMRAVATAHKNRSLHEFEEMLDKYDDQLRKDAIVESHLAQLYDNLLEQNLQRIIEPYSKVEIDHVASVIDLPLEKVEAKLSQMILDKRFAGTLDQGAGCLIIFDQEDDDATYTAALETMNNMSNVVESLRERAKALDG